MTSFTFDAKVFVTVRVKAPDEDTARSFLDDLIDHIEGVEANPKATLGEVQGCVVSASQDGEADLVEIDGDAL